MLLTFKKLKILLNLKKTYKLQSTNNLEKH